MHKKNNIVGISICLSGLVLLFSSCGKPELFNLYPGTGTKGTIVDVSADNTFGADIYWDYGLPSQTILPTSYLRGNIFTVPLDASLGPHPVRLAVGSDFFRIRQLRLLLLMVL